MARKEEMTAGQFAQYGHHVFEGVGRIPNRTLAQGHLGNSQMVAACKQFGREVLGPLLRAIETGTTSMVLVMSKLLEGVTTVAANEHETFMATDFFREGGEIRFWFDDNFRKYFLSGKGKIEIGVPTTELRVHTLRRVSGDEPIIRDLGGESVVETSLAYMAELISRQPQGQKGVLLTNGWANIFYIRDSSDTLWTVDCCWSSGDRRWRVVACPIPHPYGWLGGDQVFSH